MEFSVRVFAFFLLLSPYLLVPNTSNASIPGLEASIESKVQTAASIIVMQDIIAVVNTGNPGETVSSFTVYDGTTVVYTDSTQSYTAQYDLSSLSPGTYTAVAITSSGQEIENQIVIS